ncbi:MAG: putative NADH-dependent dehydrogenase [Bryobacterales bacterium]|nr:putative NADH-dependent dehydrogenase [Bryobacterales bacterium]
MSVQSYASDDALGTAETPESESYSNVITWDVPARSTHPALRMVWYDGGMRPNRPIEMASHTPMPKEGLLFIGEKGKMISGYYGGKNVLLPEGKFSNFQPPANCNFDVGSQMTEIALLGKMAARSARPLEFDTKIPAFSNDAEANSWINPPYRPGWKLS